MSHWDSQGWLHCLIDGKAETLAPSSNNPRSLLRCAVETTSRVARRDGPNDRRDGRRIPALRLGSPRTVPGARPTELGSGCDGGAPTTDERS